MYIPPVIRAIASGVVALSEQVFPGSRDATRSRRAPLLWAVIFLIAAAIRIPHLVESLWFDEVWRTDVILRTGNLSALLFHDVHNPLYNVLMYVWTAAFGDSEVAVRAPSLIAGTALIVVVRRWAAQRISLHVANLGAVILLLSPVHAWYSCEAKNNMLVVLLTTLAVLEVDRFVLSRLRRHAVRLALWSILAVLTSWQATLLLVPAWFFAFVAVWVPGSEAALRGMRRTSITRLAGAGVVTLAALLPLLVFKASHLDELQRWYVAPLDVPSVIKLVCIWLPTGNGLVRIRPDGWMLWAAIFGSLILPLLARGVWTLRTSGPGVLAVVCFSSPIIILAAVTLAFVAVGEPSPHIYQERNVLVMLPWFAILLAAGLSRAGRASAILHAVIYLLLTASSLAIVTWRRDKPTVMFPNPDWRAAADFIRLHAAHDSPPVIVSCCPLLPLRYYLPEAVELIEIEWNADVAALVLAQRTLHPHADVFFINNPCWFGHPSDELKGLESRLGYASRLEANSLQVYSLPRPAPKAP